MSKLFTLHEQDAYLTNVNHRVEKHGEDPRLACDLELTFDTANDFLSEFHPTLKWSLYDRPEQPDLADTDTHMPVLRYTKIERLAWTEEWVNCALTFHRLRDDIELLDCKVNKVRIEPKQGGSVSVRFRVQYNPDPTKPAVMGKIDAMLEDGVCTISLARPLDSEVQVNTNTPEPNPLDKRAAEKKAKASNGRDHGADDDHDGEDDEHQEDEAGAKVGQPPKRRRRRNGAAAAVE